MADDVCGLNGTIFNRCSELIIILLAHTPLLFFSIVGVVVRQSANQQQSTSFRNLLKLSFRSPTFWCVFAAQLFLILQLFFFSSSTFQFYPALPVVSIVEQAFVLIIWAIFILYRMLESPLNEPRAIEKVVRLVAVKSLFFGAILRWTNYGIFDPRCYLLTVACLLHAFAFLVDSNLCKFMRNTFVWYTIQEDEIQLEITDESASLWSRAFFCWTNCLVKKGYQRQLNSTDDLFPLPNYLNPSAINDELSQVFSQRSQKFSLAHYIFDRFSLKFLTLGFLRLFGDIVKFFNPILLHLLIDSFQDTSKGNNFQKTTLIVVSMSSALLLSSFLDFNFNFYVQKMALRIRMIVLLSVYGKLLKVPTVNFSRADITTGRLLNFVSTDIDRAVNFFTSFHSIWSMPLNLCIALLLLYREIGFAFLSGLFAAFLLVPVNKFVADLIGKMSVEMMKMKDERLKLVNEYVRSTRTIKLNCWEGFFEKRICVVREKELVYLKWRKYLDAICVYLWASAPVFITLSILVTFIWVLGEKLTAAKIFTTLALVNILILPMNAFPWVLNSLIEAIVSKRRFDLLFSLDDIVHPASFSVSDHGKNPELLLQINSVFFSWTQKRIAAKEFSLTGKKGQIIGIMGPVGAGKSTILLGILGEALASSSSLASANCVIEVNVRALPSGFGYVAQESWLQRDSIRKNILSGGEFDPVFYRRVIEACALSTDLEALPGNDEFIVGNDGGSLSGGQRTRLALARAVYQNCEIYLLDDPFASLDRTVGRHIFQNCIQGILKARGALVLLCTHQPDFLRQADWIIQLGPNGGITNQGLPSDVLTLPAESISVVDNSPKNHGDEDSRAEFVPPAAENIEEKKEGTVSIWVYLAYVRSVGTILSAGILASLVAMQATKNGSDVWLGLWASANVTTKTKNYEDQSSLISPIHFMGPAWSDISLNPLPLLNRIAEAEVGKRSENYYLLLYVGVTVANTLFTLSRAFLFAYGGLVAARFLHNKLIKRVLRLSWWDATPSGRVINRLSSDVFMVDDSLPFQANILLATMFNLTGTLVVTAFALPLLLPLILLLLLAYYFIQRYYRYTTVGLKRLGSVSMSPLYNHITDTVAGLVTIRAHRFSERFVVTLCARLGANMRAQYSQLACSQWLSVRLQLIGVAIVSAITFGSVLQFRLFGANTGLVGLAITYALSFTNVLNSFLTSFIETEKELVSVERVSEYIDGIPMEKQSSENDENEGPEEDSTGREGLDLICRRTVRGRLSFIGVNFAYSPGMPLALRDVTFDVDPGQRVAIIGRTGSGKSSIFQTLLRAYPLDSGRIYIDGIVDIHQLQLKTLRSLFGYVSQSPFIFGGTVRENLLLNSNDFNENAFDDASLESLLEKAGLGDWLHRIGGLDAEIVESGNGLSLGEKQLICLCRLVLSRPRVVLIDEATAHVDEARHISVMEELQRMLGQETTVLCIVHRLTGLETFDLIIEMSNGTVSRQGPPSEFIVF